MDKKVVNTGLSGIIGDSHRYSNDNGIISLVHPCFGTMDMFEIYCIEGDLFHDIERFHTLIEAEDIIKELLDFTRYDRNDKINSIIT